MLTSELSATDPAAGVPGDDDPDPWRPGDPASEPPSHADRIALLNNHPEARPDDDWLLNNLARLWDHLDSPLVGLSVVLVDDAAMSELHDRYLGDASTTDVITFDLADEPGTIEGELVLCVDEAARQAERHGHRIEHELLLYAVHGVLHLTGHDDHDPDEARAMHLEEDRLLTLIGVGPVYSRKRENSPG